jgi:hypothetical protein
MKYKGGTKPVIITIQALVLAAVLLMIHSRSIMKNRIPEKKWWASDHISNRVNNLPGIPELISETSAKALAFCRECINK